MKVRLSNLASKRRTVWVDVAVPHSLSLGKYPNFVTKGGVKFRAVKGGNQGKHSTFYRVLATLAGHETLDGDLVPSSSDYQPPVFKYSSWVTDDVNAIIAGLIVRIGGKDCRITSPVVTSIGRSAAHEQWYLKGGLTDPDTGILTGFVGQVWVTFYHEQDVADIKANVVWSDRNDPKVEKQVDGVGFECGEYVHLDFSVRNGFEGPFKLGDQWTWVISGPISFIDGSALAISGRMLCMPQNQDDVLPIALSDADTMSVVPSEAVLQANRIESLQAALEAPVKGCIIVEGWDKSWLSLKNTPRNRVGEYEDANVKHRAFIKMLEVPVVAQIGWPPAKMYHQRHLGTNRKPFITGKQEDFGSTKGSMTASLGDPRWLWEVEQSIHGDFFRGFMHFENDGAFLLYENHQGWLTWGGYTHFRQRPSDTLGKRPQSPWQPKATGWQGYDDQHRSMNNLCAYLALSDDPMMMDMLIHHIRTDQSMYRNRIGATRSVGRLLLAWSHAHKLLPEAWANRAYNLIMEKISSVYNLMPGRKHQNPVKVISWGFDVTHGVSDGKGNILPSWVVWEHGLAAIGLYAAYKASNDQRTLEMLIDVTRTIVEFGTFQEGGKWYICNNVWYPLGKDEGKPITSLGVTYSTTTPQVNVGYWWYGGVSNWAFMGILIFVEVWPHDDPLLNRAQEIVRQRTGGLEASTWSTAEWMACVEKIF